VFDYASASRSDILARARLLDGKRLGELPEARFTTGSASRSKAEVGHLIEAFFGIPRNSRAEADFPGANIELKVVPLRRTPDGFRAKERTFLSMIDYHAIVGETWDSASVRKKLSILFVFYQDKLGIPKEEFEILGVELFIPDERQLALLGADWVRVQAKVRHGRAHLLTETDGRIMTPSTKGAGGGQLRSQPFGEIKAKPRAFALKPAFTSDRFLSLTRPQAAESIVEALDVRSVDLLEAAVLEELAAFEGQRVGDVAASLSIPLGAGKSFAANVVRRLVGGARSARIVEFNEMGATLRSPRVRPDLLPYEAVSFPAFRYADLIDESWTDSDLLARIEYMLFVPLVGAKRSTPQADCEIAGSRVWRPSASDVDLIQREWELFRIEIERGRADALTPSSETTAIHIRPHAKNAADTDVAPLVGPTVKKSFWLNKSFVQDILAGRR
jgi:DNA mismatch repair endonuclease MutH